MTTAAKGAVASCRDSRRQLLADSVEKSFLGDEQKFLGPLMRFARGDVRDHVVSHKNDHGPSYRLYRALSAVSYSIASIGRRGARLGCREPAIDRVGRAGRVAGVVGQQEGDKARYVFGCAVTAKGNRLGEGLVPPGEPVVG